MIKLDISILWNIINILVLYLILKKFLIKPVLNVIGKRQALIDDSFETAKTKQQDADKLKEEYTEKLANINDQADRIINKAQTDMALAYDRTIKEAKDNAARITKNAEITVEQKKQQAIEQAKEHIADLVINTTEKLVSSKDLSNTNNDLYDKFIKDSGDGNGHDQ